MSLPQTGLGSACAGRGSLIHIRWPPTPSWHPPKLQGLHQASTSAHWHTDAQKGACREHRFRLGGAYCRGWQILLRHPLSSPFPASFPDCKGTIKNLKCSLPAIPAQTLAAHLHRVLQAGSPWGAQALNVCYQCRAWQVISHPLSSNPFPASFLNCKSSIKILPVLIPGGQSFVQWKMELLTELHAREVMQTIIDGMMRVGLLSKSSPNDYDRSSPN